MNKPKRFIIFLGIAVIIIDQVAKWSWRVFFKDFLLINPGGVFGLAVWQNIPQLLFVAISVIVALLLWRYERSGVKTPITQGIALIIGGILSNALDRIFFGGVLDFIRFRLGVYEWPAFNIADLAIVIGVFLVIIGYFLENKNRYVSSSK